ncbi:helix-turn-helix domain-containing protein [Robinsoniella sp. RHS]|uniref:helix-turn-helix domain-containing protein n=1 Tax=Robinsoniella sp. RHS TaxID=1504536 RepID=UPI00064949F4
MESINPYAKARNKIVAINESGREESQFYLLQMPFGLTYECCRMSEEKKRMKLVDLAFGKHADIEVDLSDYDELEPSKSPMHQHNYFEFMYVLKGEVCQHIEKASYQYQAGYGCLLNCSTRHNEEFSTDFEAVFLCMSPEFIEDIMKKCGRKLYREGEKKESVLFHFFDDCSRETKNYKKNYIDLAPVRSDAMSSVHEQILHYFDQAAVELLNTKTGSLFFIQGILCSLFELFEDGEKFRMSHIRLDSGKEDHLFVRLTQYLEQEHRAVSRKDISLAFNYHPDYLNRIVKKYTGMTLGEYSQSFALKEAQRMLAEEGRTVTYVMQELGFTNRNYFYRVFQHRYKISPGEMRKNGPDTPGFS